MSGPEDFTGRQPPRSWPSVRAFLGPAIEKALEESGVVLVSREDLLVVLQMAARSVPETPRDRLAAYGRVFDLTSGDAPGEAVGHQEATRSDGVAAEDGQDAPDVLRDADGAP